VSNKVTAALVCVLDDHLGVKHDVEHKHAQSSVELNGVQSARQETAHHHVQEPTLRARYSQSPLSLFRESKVVLGEMGAMSLGCATTGMNGEKVGALAHACARG